MRTPIVPCHSSAEAEQRMQECLTAAYNVIPGRHDGGQARAESQRLHQRAREYREIASTLRRAGK